MRQDTTAHVEQLWAVLKKTATLKVFPRSTRNKILKDWRLPSLVLLSQLQRHIGRPNTGSSKHKTQEHLIRLQTYESTLIADIAKVWQIARLLCLDCRFPTAFTSHAHFKRSPQRKKKRCSTCWYHSSVENENCHNGPNASLQMCLLPCVPWPIAPLGDAWAVDNQLHICAIRSVEWCWQHPWYVTTPTQLQFLKIF